MAVQVATNRGTGAVAIPGRPGRRRSVEQPVDVHVGRGTGGRPRGNRVGIRVAGAGRHERHDVVGRVDVVRAARIVVVPVVDVVAVVRDGNIVVDAVSRARAGAEHVGVRIGTRIQQIRGHVQMLEAHRVVRIVGDAGVVHVQVGADIGGAGQISEIDGAERHVKNGLRTQRILGRAVETRVHALVVPLGHVSIPGVGHLAGQPDRDGHAGAQIARSQVAAHVGVEVDRVDTAHVAAGAQGHDGAKIVVVEQAAAKGALGGAVRRRRQGGHDVRA